MPPKRKLTSRFEQAELNWAKKEKRKLKKLARKVAKKEVIRTEVQSIPRVLGARKRVMKRIPNQRNVNRRRSAVTTSGQALVSKTSNKSNSHRISVAPDHPVFGPGDRHTFYYMGREVARTGVTDAQTVGGAAPAANNEYTVMRTPKSGGTTYRYDSSAIFMPFGYPSNSTTSSAYGCAFATSITSGTSNYDFNPIFDTLKYYDQVAVRVIRVEYDPSVAYTATGNLVLSAENDWTQVYTAANVKGYDSQSSTRLRVKTKISEKAQLHLLNPTAKALAMPSPQCVQVNTYARDNNEPGWVLRAAVDTTLSLNAVDRIGSLSFFVVLDCYSYHWNSDLYGWTALLSDEDRFLENYQRLVQKKEMKDDERKDLEVVPFERQRAIMSQSTSSVTNAMFGMMRSPEPKRKVVDDDYVKVDEKEMKEAKDKRSKN